MNVAKRMRLTCCCACACVVRRCAIALASSMRRCRAAGSISHRSIDRLIQTQTMPERFPRRMAGLCIDARCELRVNGCLEGSLLHTHASGSCVRTNHTQQRRPQPLPHSRRWRWRHVHMGGGGKQGGRSQRGPQATRAENRCKRRKARLPIRETPFPSVFPALLCTPSSTTPCVSGVSHPLG